MIEFFLKYEAIFSKLHSLKIMEAQLLSMFFKESRLLSSNLVGKYALNSFSFTCMSPCSWVMSLITPWNRVMLTK